MKHRLFHKIWTIVFVAPSLLRGKKKCKRGEEATHGDCDDPASKNKKIRIANNLGPMEQMDAVIHECLHASDWFKDEAWIDVVATDIARLLWKMGWRLTKDGDLTRPRRKKKKQQKVD